MALRSSSAARPMPWIALVYAAALHASSCGPPRPSGPNVLLISIDSLRADHLGCYGYGRQTSPRIDGLAAAGTLFESATSSTSWTLPAHAALFTGLPDSVHGCERSESVLAAGRRTLAEQLARAGYDTAGLWSGPYLHPRFGLAQGFERYESCASFEFFRRGELGSKGATSAVQGRVHRRSHEDVTSPRLVERAESFLRERRDRPFFLFVHMWDVHYDYLPPEPYDGLFTDPAYAGPVDGRDLGSDPRMRDPLPAADVAQLVGLYDGEIAWTDHHVGRLLDLLDELGVADDTLVILTADHGEEFFEHRRFGHRKALFAESVDVPLIVRWPDRVPAGRRVRGLARLVDVAPTVLELCGAPGLPDVLGRSLVPELEDGGAGSGAAFAFSELVRARRQDRLIAVEDQRVKWIVEREGRRSLGLFDKRADPLESVDLTGARPDLQAEAEELLERVLGLLDRLAVRHPEAPADGGPMSPELERELRSLGYLGRDD